MFLIAKLICEHVKVILFTLDVITHINFFITLITDLIAFVFNNESNSL